ncbi:alpha-mannosyltransferase KNAG_0K01300 [Huiozyma naganishii CBS 8797]|uniref:Uncharacterized protein n=1 Tax=Huiozyma naganishii (strain ATCC MYA-139 / BCRC 22969 / CBS 8797 / KCTC 17520 / NBRC 10181 / NCYC 3082 / Yp74L-3) TaxID=1071383 RepID=J7RCB3_HUIN7|nr:hypothetical protein KNAG_0K01300 [Kazachstania naganishii CBS 8797]CCK72495.1 hypothetical protein KNAG_0K01300 [Kazachstania naganishii CBS 8797]
MAIFNRRYMLNRRLAKLFKAVFFLVIVCLVCAGLTHHFHDGPKTVDEYKEFLQGYLGGNANTTVTVVNDADKIKSYYNTVFENLLLFSPKGETARAYGDKCILNEAIGTTSDNIPKFERLSYENLLDCLKLSNEELSALKLSHNFFVQSLDVKYPKGMYQGDGIVMVGGGKYSLMAYLVIKHLRSSGTSLPVEVFIPPNEEDETEFCETALPELNAQCIFIDRILPSAMIKTFHFKGYQFKSLALVSSSFENVLLLDADNYPVRRLDDIFKQEPFKSTGLILWPDFWRRTTTPLFYNISGVAIDLTSPVRYSFDDLTPPEVYFNSTMDRSKIPVNDFAGAMPDVSTESGQLLINKRTHLKTILLSLYYNVNGPAWYYPIIAQRAPGEGDKDTFIAAANFYGLPWYQVKTRVGIDGYSEDGQYHGVGMLQYDFVQDYELYQSARRDITAKYGVAGPSKTGQLRSEIAYDENYSLDTFEEKYFNKEKSGHKVMFIHANFPKFDPLSLWQDKKFINKQGSTYRTYNNLGKFNYWDIELYNFNSFETLFCSGADSVTWFPYMNRALQGNTNDRESMCSYIRMRLDHLEQTHHEATVPKPTH